MKYIRILIAICTILLTAPSLYAQKTTEATTPKYEMRGVWLTTIHNLDWPSKAAQSASDEERQQRELVRMLDQFQTLGINTVFLQVRGRGELIYPSDVEPMSPAIAYNYTPKTDLLKFAIRECHLRGMSVHAWLVVMPLGPESHWRKLGRKSYAWTNRANVSKVGNGYFMNPGDPATGRHMRKIVAELLTKYDLEGIHLDYIRYNDRGNTFPDVNAYKRSHSKLSLEEWRRQNVANVVKDIYDEIQLHDKNVLLSAAVIGSYTQIPGFNRGWTARDDVYQDPVLWDKGNYIDFIVPMHYIRGSKFIPVLKDWEKRFHKPIVAGLAAYNVLPNEGDWPNSEITSQTTTVQQDSLLSGVTYFRADQIISPSPLYRLIKEKNFNYPVLPYSWINENDTTTKAPIAPQWLESTVEGNKMSLKWVNRNQQPVLFAVYARAKGEKPSLDSGRDLIMVTTNPEAELDLDKLMTGDEDYLQIEVSTFDIKTRRESFTLGGAAYYRKPANPVIEGPAKPMTSNPTKPTKKKKKR